MRRPRGERFVIGLSELNGAFGDLGTLLPLMLGAIAVAGLAPTPVLLGTGAFYIATALYYRLPIPVQPMKAVAAVMLTTGVTAGGLAASGVVIGLVLLILGVTGLIAWTARLVPQSVLAGLQLGLGLALALVSLDLMTGAPLIASVTLGLLVALMLAPRLPAVLIALAAAIVLARIFEVPPALGALEPAAFALPGLPSLEVLRQSATQLVLPQLALTFTNAILITALVAGDYFGDRAAHVTPARLSVTSGLASVILAPLGALPLCHGAGGLAAHYRFGARSGTAPLVMGAILVAFALLPGGLGPAALAAIPAAGLGALLLVASAELALSKRLFDCQPSCWPVIAVTAGATLWADPFLGLLAGSIAEIARRSAIRMLQRDARG